MLNSFRQTVALLAGVICMALLAMWLTGAHGHRHVGGDSHRHALAGSAAHHDDAGHSHEEAHADSPPAHDHFQPHPLSLIHGDGHENIELKGLQPPPGTQFTDTPVLALLLCAVFLLARPRRFRVSVIDDPPINRLLDQSLRPPLRGPPLFSVA